MRKTRLQSAFEENDCFDSVQTMSYFKRGTFFPSTFVNVAALKVQKTQKFVLKFTAVGGNLSSNKHSQEIEGKGQLWDIYFHFMKYCHRCKFVLYAWSPTPFHRLLVCICITAISNPNILPGSMAGIKSFFPSNWQVLHMKQRCTKI